jgi:hypothetical protein
MRTTTPAEILQKAKIRADLVYSSHTSDAEALLLLDDAYRSLYSLMMTQDESLFLKTATVTLVDYQAELPQDLFKLAAVSYSMGGVIVKLDQIALQDRLGTQLTSYLTNPVYYIQDNYIKCEGVGNTNIDLLYVPTPTDITSMSQSIQLIHNEDQYLQGCLWRDMLQREESDTRAAEVFIAQAVMRIKNQLTPKSRDNTTVVDAYSNRKQPWFRGRMK